MKAFRRLPALALAVFCAAPAYPARCPLITQPEPDWQAVTGTYPQAGTVPALGEQAVLFWLQRARTAQDVDRASGENTVSFGCYAQDITLAPGLLGGAVDLHDFPRTQAILDHARADVWPVLQTLRATYNRPRPFQEFQGLDPALPEADTPSFPSAHAMLGCFFGCIIAQYDPTDRAALEATGQLLGTDRVLGGVHYPSDVTAGQKLGHAYATWWINQHLGLIQTACDEWSAARAKAWARVNGR
jgi:hypothetical protein